VAVQNIDLQNVDVCRKLAVRISRDGFGSRWKLTSKSLRTSISHRHRRRRPHQRQASVQSPVKSRCRKSSANVMRPGTAASPRSSNLFDVVAMNTLRRF